MFLLLLLILEVSDSKLGREDGFSYNLIVFLRFSSQVLEQYLKLRHVCALALPFLTFKNLAVSFRTDRFNIPNFYMALSLL